MTRISEAVECLEGLGYTITAPGGEGSARATVDALVERPFESLNREECLLFAIFSPERYWENRAVYHQERAETAEAKLDRISAMACDDDAGAWNAHQPLIVAITAATSAVQS